MKYQRLSAYERERISQMLVQKMPLRTIANELGRCASTISREVARIEHHGRVYSAVEAQADAERCSSQRRQRRKLSANPKLWKIVRKKLALRWAPQQIASYLKETYPEDASMQVSHETIYTYLYLLPRGELKKQLLAHLRRKHPTRRRRTSLNAQRGIIAGMISIEERPAEVADRSIAGHWEGDLILGAMNRSAIGTIVERTTRLVLLVKLEHKDAESVRRAFARKMASLPRQLARSLTYDQGKEMAEHKLFTAQTKIVVYFAHPHSPWERGTCENTNGLIRDYFPKGTDFSTVSAAELRKVQQQLNERPRKTLGWKTPAYAFAKVLASIDPPEQHSSINLFPENVALDT
jgi:IS30 family transposase